MSDNEIILDTSIFANLEGKNVVFTGGASGIGREAVTIFANAGANVTFGDIDKVSGARLAAELGERVNYKETDVTSFQSLKDLFAAAAEVHGAPDIVCANAGIHEHEDWLSEEYLEKDCAWRATQVNFIGVLNTIKLAFLSFKRSGKPGSIVMTASAAGYMDTSPVCYYAGTKHAVVGLLRSFTTIAPVYGARINLIAPWMTDTPFAGDEVLKRWKGLPINKPETCAQAIVFAAINPELHGCGIWVGGDRLFEVEKGYLRTRPQWLGQEMSDNFQEGWERLSAPFGQNGALSTLH
ncbi:hypothetical protein EDB81DRAFT_785730 [Dactylonectria macrodidyma]|uniref:Uncharacterized protein n=1 Tax=Dactylonectria macrodidyma TaxID=307937 RepID=A0A9P9FJ58_9HYPO|nr:hypothetical protein EDB81DRAFT_785730 [Dactylonectria macrodidyma]